MKKIFIFVIGIILIVGSCVVIASNRINIKEELKSVATVDVPINAITMKDKRLDEIYKDFGNYFESTSSEDYNEVLYDRKITDAEAIKIATEFLKDISDIENATSTNVEFLLYTNIYSGIEQRPVVVVTFDNVKTSLSSGPATKTTEKQKSDVVQTKVLLDALTGDFVTEMCMGYNY